MNASRRGEHGFWPYLAPYSSFLLLAEVGRRLPEVTAGPMLFVKPLVPLLLIVWFWRGGSYAELRTGRPSLVWTLADAGVGVALCLLWMAPYVLFDSLRPDPEEAFDPTILGAELVWLTLAVRMFGYAIVTPLFEEIFIRSWAMRFFAVWWDRGDFRNVPIAHFTLGSFVATIIVFTLGHVPWEWWVAVPWVALTNLWFYYRRNLLALIVVHGVTNASLLLFAIYGGGLFHTSDGEPLSLWFFV
jgi:CAAX prenyl protease-like protein